MPTNQTSILMAADDRHAVDDAEKENETPVHVVLEGFLSNTPLDKKAINPI
jgi:hypothetical protein